MLKEAWPDFIAFYGTSATGASWIVPKKYVEKVGEGYKKAPVGAGPFKFVSFKPGVELVLEAFPDYWRKAPQVKRIVMRSIPDESTRAAAVKTGEVDIAYLFVGAVAEDLKRTPGVKIAAPLLYGVYWLDFLDQWDPKSPWHDRRVRQAASAWSSTATRSTRRRCWATARPAGFVPPEFDFALKVEPPPPLDIKRAKQLLTEAGYPNGFDAGDLTPLPPYTSLGETVGGYLQGIGNPLARADDGARHVHDHWHEKKLKGLLIGATGAAGNAAARLEPFFTKGGIYAYGSRPEIDDLFQRQAKELDRKKREALLHQIQKIVADQVMVAPIFQQGFIWGVSLRVDVPGAGLIQGYPYAAPCEDLKLK